MLAINKSRLQDEEEQFHKADPRYQQVSCWTPERSPLAIIEVVWER
jgi:hypothetical protein